MKQVNDNFQWTEETIRFQLEQINHEVNQKRKSKLVSELNQLDKWDYTTLMWACINSHFQIASNLLEYSEIDLNIQNELEETTLMVACQYCSELVPVLLKQPGLDINAQIDTGLTALMEACAVNSEIVPCFLNHPNLDINIQDMIGQTALMEACTDSPEVVPYFLNHPDLDINIQNNNEWTALMWACKENPSIVPDLLNYPNIDVTNEDNKGWNALMVTCNFNPQSISKLLNHSNILFDFLNNNKEKVFDFAQQCDNDSYQIMKDFIDNNQLKNNIESSRNNEPEKML